jgi:crotonobetainyl-CoA:carnitine CoA-transferase CaiB-like acyl-CoA transferase
VATRLLAGVRIIDATAVVLGPYATQILGDMGADVIKLEAPEGDMMRHAQPARSPGMSAQFLTPNRSKRGIVLNLKLPGAHAALLRLIATADVFVHNMRQAAAETLGLGYRRLREANPRLIYAAACGFGSSGPYAGRPAFDDIVQALSGIVDLNGRAQGKPSFVPSTMVDKITGLHLASAIAMALFHRERSGEGSEIEVPMLEVMTSFLMVEHLSAATFIGDGGAVGYRRLLGDRGPYRTEDGYVAVLPYTRRQWLRFFTAAGRPDLAADPRVTDDVKRSHSLDELYATVAELLPARKTAEWLALFAELDIPAAPIRSFDSVLEEPHLAATGFFKEMMHPSEGAVRVPGIPIRVDGAEGEITRLAPRLGEHTRDVLGEAGLSTAEIDALCRSGAAVDGR